MEYTQAVNYARMKLEEMSVKTKVEEGKEEGKFDDHFRWQVEIKKADILPAEGGTDFKPPVELFKVKVDVIWMSGSKETSTHIESYRIIKPEEEKRI